MFAPSKQVSKSLTDFIVLSRNDKDKQFFTPMKSATKKYNIFTNPVNIDTATSKKEWIEGKLDLNEYLVNNPLQTFLMRVKGDSMLKAGINTGDLLVVDRSLRSSNGKIVVASINNELTVKRINYTAEAIYLVPENENYEPIVIGEGDVFEIWGVVTAVIKKV